MSDPTLVKIQQWLKDHEQELLDSTVKMLRVPSIQSDPEPNAPYGKANRQALDLALQQACEWGMKVKDLEGYIGYAEFGQGERLVMSLGHLDVVPVSDGWKHEPFGAEIDNGYIYARGAVDDKGPTMASFFAMRAIQECAPNIPARMRIAFGCNEESGFGCVKRYMETEEAPTYGVAPDSGWPLYHAEKGIMNMTVRIPLPKGDLEILSLEGGQRHNIVIDSFKAKIRLSDSVLAEFKANLEDSWDANIKYNWEDANTLSITAVGKACHGAWPFGGDSAATRVFRFLFEMSPLSSKDFYQALLFSSQSSGAGLGILGADDVSKDLTANLGIVKIADDEIELLINVRYPVTWKGADIQAKCAAYLKKLPGNFRLESVSDSEPLYFPIDHPLVQTIKSVYKEETGEDREPGTMGGGTYARAIPNSVSIGTGWEGDGNPHENDERLKVEHLYKMSRIYAHILYKLAIMK